MPEPNINGGSEGNLRVIQSGLSLLSAHREYNQAVDYLLSLLSDQAARAAVKAHYNGDLTKAAIESGKSLAYMNFRSDVLALVKTNRS